MPHDHSYTRSYLLKTEDICESINARYKEYSVDYYAEELVSLLYNHFIDKAFNNKNGLKTCI